MANCATQHTLSTRVNDQARNITFYKTLLNEYKLNIHLKRGYFTP